MQPDNIEGIVGVANCLYDLKRLRDATVFYERALEINGRYGKTSGGSKLPG